MELTAEEKIRQTLSGNPFVAPHFQHEGPDVVRWITGGTDPDAYVTLERQGDEMVARCPTCRMEFGRYDAAYGEKTGAQITALRAVGAAHQREQGHVPEKH